MNKQLQEDMAESQSEHTIEAKAVAMLLARNERLTSLLGCVVESVEAMVAAGTPISPQLQDDLDFANKALDEYEENPLY